MSTIAKPLQGMLYTGPALVLATAPFRNSLNIIYGFNAAGTGYTSFKPGGSFNSLTRLEQDKAYIVDAATLGFDLPGAVLVAVAPVIPPDVVTEVVTLSNVVYLNNGTNLGKGQVKFNAASSNPAAKFLCYTDDENSHASGPLAGPVCYYNIGEDDSASDGLIRTLHVVTTTGGLASASFEFLF